MRQSLVAPHPSNDNTAHLAHQHKPHPSAYSPSCCTMQLEHKCVCARNGTRTRVIGGQPETSCHNHPGASRLGDARVRCSTPCAVRGCWYYHSPVVVPAWCEPGSCPWQPPPCCSWNIKDKKLVVGTTFIPHPTHHQHLSVGQGQADVPAAGRGRGAAPFRRLYFTPHLCYQVEYPTRRRVCGCVCVRAGLCVHVCGWVGYIVDCKRVHA